MLNNLINHDDLKRLTRRLGSGRCRALVRWALEGSGTRVKKAWEHTQSPPSNWWNIPEVRERWNFLLTGNPYQCVVEYLANRYLRELRDPVALSLGCGTGHNELEWARLGVFKRIEGLDVSAQRIETAHRNAVTMGLDFILHFEVGDIYKLNRADQSYDVLLAIQSLHHFSPLRPLLEKLSQMLKPNGLLFLNEFVGPNRFQWTARQMEAINGLLTLLPPRLRVQWGSEKIKERVVRPSRLSMMLSDPSESVESSRILPLLYELFEVVEIRNYGGAVLHMLLQGIAHNFRSDDPEAQRYLRLFFEAEDLMMQSGEIQSDFVVVVCRQRKLRAAGSPLGAKLRNPASDRRADNANSVLP